MVSGLEGKMLLRQWCPWLEKCPCISAFAKRQDGTTSVLAGKTLSHIGGVSLRRTALASISAGGAVGSVACMERKGIWRGTDPISDHVIFHMAREDRTKSSLLSLHGVVLRWRCVLSGRLLIHAHSRLLLEQNLPNSSYRGLCSF